MKKKLLFGLLFLSLFIVTGCGKSTELYKEYGDKKIVISNVDEKTRWGAITKYDITLEFENGKCVSENYRLEFAKESNALVYGIDMEGKTYIEDYKQEGNVVTYKRTGINNEFYDKTFEEASAVAKMLYPTAEIKEQ